MTNECNQRRTSFLRPHLSSFKKMSSYFGMGRSSGSKANKAEPGTTDKAPAALSRRQRNCVMSGSVVTGNYEDVVGMRDSFTEAMDGSDPYTLYGGQLEEADESSQRNNASNNNLDASEEADPLSSFSQRSCQHLCQEYGYPWRHD